jgi:hypothetical protein
MMSTRIRVYSHVQIIRHRFWLNDHVQVPAFKLRVKDQLVFFILQLRIHARKRWFIIK